MCGWMRSLKNHQVVMPNVCVLHDVTSCYLCVITGVVRLAALWPPVGCAVCERERVRECVCVLHDSACYYLCVVIYVVRSGD